MVPILYEDEWVLVCLKPPGLLAQDGPAGRLCCGISWAERSIPSTGWTGKPAA